MSDYNHVSIIGRLTKNPELKTTTNGSTVCDFSIATNHYAGKDRDEGVAFVDCVAWTKVGEIIAKHFRKGKKIFVSGELRQDRWEKDGKKYQRMRVLVKTFAFMDSNGAKSESSAVESAPPDVQTDGADFGDDESVPF